MNLTGIRKDVEKLKVTVGQSPEAQRHRLADELIALGLQLSLPEINHPEALAYVDYVAGLPDDADSAHPGCQSAPGKHCETPRSRFSANQS